VNEMIASFKQGISTTADSKDELRVDICSILKDARAPATSNVIRDEGHAMKKLKQGDDILILFTNKSNATVVMNKSKSMFRIPIHIHLPWTNRETKNPALKEVRLTYLQNLKVPDTFTETTPRASWVNREECKGVCKFVRTRAISASPNANVDVQVYQKPTHTLY